MTLLIFIATLLGFTCVVIGLIEIIQEKREARFWALSTVFWAIAFLLQSLKCK